MDPRMGPMDAVMFDVETDPLLRSVITILVELDSEPDISRLRYRVDRLTRLLPKLRQRVVGNPLSPVPPRWEVDPNFDFDYHFRTEELAEISRDALLAEISTWAEHDFDQARPLWEMLYLSAPKGERCAVALKIHHSITDGVGGMQLAAALFDIEPDAEDPSDFPDIPKAHPLGWLDRLNQAAQFQATNLVGDTVNAAKYVLDAGRVAIQDPAGSAMTTSEFLASANRVLTPANEPLSPIMRDRSLTLWFGETSVDLSDLKSAGKAAGGTLNDAFVAGVVGGLRAYHERYGEVPDELRMHMPINRRGAGEGGSNAWVPARFPVPMNAETAKSRLRQLHPVLAAARDEPALAVSQQVYKLLMALPRGITTLVAGGLMKGTDFVATNVPGPPMPVYLAGSRVHRLIPFAPKGGAAVNVALMSYNGRAEIGINIDTGAVAHPAELHDLIVEAYEDIVATVS